MLQSTRSIRVQTAPGSPECEMECRARAEQVIKMDAELREQRVRLRHYELQLEEAMYRYIPDAHATTIRGSYHATACTLFGRIDGRGGADPRLSGGTTRTWKPSR